MIHKMAFLLLCCSSVAANFNEMQGKESIFRLFLKPCMLVDFTGHAFIEKGPVSVATAWLLVRIKNKPAVFCPHYQEQQSAYMTGTSNKELCSALHRAYERSEREQHKH